VEAIADIVQEHGNCRVVDLANRFGVSHVTVTRTISRLLEEGWVQTAPYRPIALTGKGRRLATEARRRHAIVYRFLIAVGVDERTAAIDAEGIEHHVSPQTLVRLEEFTRGASRAPRK
jgi:DtxR family manganese transport transcriptional regulator